MLQIAACHGELLGAPAERARQVIASGRQVGVGHRQLVGPGAVVREQAGVFDRDRRLIGKGAQGRELSLEAHPGPQTGLDVKRADRAAHRRRSADGDARDGLDHQLVHADCLREPLVVARADRHDGLAALDHLLGDGARETSVRVVASRAGACGLCFEHAQLPD